MMMPHMNVTSSARPAKPIIIKPPAKSRATPCRFRINATACHATQCQRGARRASSTVTHHQPQRPRYAA
jgi:hypothetical protein